MTSDAVKCSVRFDTRACAARRNDSGTPTSCATASTSTSSRPTSSPPAASCRPPATTSATPTTRPRGGRHDDLVVRLRSANRTEHREREENYSRTRRAIIGRGAMGRSFRSAVVDGRPTATCGWKPGEASGMVRAMGRVAGAPTRRRVVLNDSSAIDVWTTTVADRV